MKDSYLAKMMRGEDVTASLSAFWGPCTEKGFPVALDLDVDLVHKGGNPDYSLCIMGRIAIKECAKLGLHETNALGQCTDVDEILARNGLWCHHLDVIVKIWKKWHMNDRCAGSEAQEKCLEKFMENCPEWKYNYDGACILLKQRGLYEDKGCIVDGKPYRYGTKWMFRRIPNQVLVDLCGALDGGLIIVPKGDRRP